MPIILLWMLVFAVTHSITADKRFKRIIINLIGERAYEGFYRLFYNGLSVIMFTLLFLYMWTIRESLYSLRSQFQPFFASFS